MNDARLKEIDARVAAATPLPWVVEKVAPGSHLVNVKTEPGGAELLEYCLPADAAFAAHARVDVPDLVARVRELEIENLVLKLRALAWDVTTALHSAPDDDGDHAWRMGL